MALYLLGLVAFRLRVSGAVGRAKLTAAAATLALYAVGGGLPAWALAAALATILVALCAAETAAGRLRSAPAR